MKSLDVDKRLKSNFDFLAQILYFWNVHKNVKLNLYENDKSFTVIYDVGNKHYEYATVSLTKVEE